MDRLIGTISAEGTLQGVLSAVCNLTGKITVGKYEAGQPVPEGTEV